MIRLVYCPDPFRPGLGREVMDIEPDDARPLRELITPWIGDTLPGYFSAMRNGDEMKLDETPVDGDFVLVARGHGAGGLEYVLISLIISTATGLLSQALLPGVETPEDPKENAPTYGYDGQIKSSRRDGAPLALAYGRFRAGGQVISESVENGRGSATSSVYAVQLSFGEGPIRSIAGLAVETADGEILRTDAHPLPFGLVGILVDGNDAAALSGVEAQIRLGTDEQTPALGFELTGTPTASGAELEAPEGPGAPNAPNIDPAVTSQTDQDSYWNTYGEAVILPSGTYDVARVTVSYPRGAFIGVGASVGRVYLNLIVRYIELDGGGSEITTGGNFGDGWVRVLPETASFQTRSPTSADFVIPFYDPATYTIPSPGGSIFFPADATGTRPELRILEANITKPAAWASGSDVSALSIECWILPVTFDNNGNAGGVDTHQLICGLYEFEDHGWSLSIETKTFDVGAGSTITKFVPVLRRHQGSSTTDYFENVNVGGSPDGISDPSFQFAVNEWAHIVVTYEAEVDPGIDRLRIYANGDLIDEIRESIGLTHGDNDFVIGHFDEETNSINALIDELIVWDRALSVEEVWRSYGYGNGMYHDPEGTQVFAYHFDNSVADFSGNSNDLTPDQVSFNATAVVPLPTSNTLKPGRYRVEVAKNNNSSNSPAAYDVPTLDSVTGMIDGAFAYSGCPVLSLKVQATEEISASAPNVTSLIEGRLLPVWTGDSVTSPTFVKKFTRNPAWVVADIVTQKRIALGSEIGPSKIDVASFQQLADFCDEWLTDGRADFRDSTNDGDPNGWTDLRYDGTKTDAETGVTRGSISIRFAAFADIPDHWRIGTGVRFDGTPAVGGNMNLDVSYPNMDGFEIYFINESPSLPFVNVYYDRVDQGEPWTGTGGSLAAAIGAGNVTGTAEGCERRFTFDAFIDTAKRGWELLIQILSTCRAVPVLDGETLRVKIRRPRSAVGFVGMGNIIPGSFEVNYVDTGANANEITVKYRDELLDYDETTETYLHPSADPTNLADAVSDDIDGFVITRRSQAHRFAVYTANINRDIKRRGSFRVGPDSVNFEVTDVLLCSHDLIPWGVGGRILTAADSGATTVQLDREVTIPASGTLYIRVRNDANSRVRQYEVDHAAGTYVSGTPISIDGTIPFPLTQDTSWVIFTDGEEVLIDITSIAFDEDLGAEVEWVEYVESVFDDSVDFSQSLSLQRGQQNQIASTTIPGNVENLTARELPPAPNSESDGPRVFASWSRPSSGPPPAGFAVWLSSPDTEPTVVAEVRGDASSAEFAVPAAITDEAYRVAVQQIAVSGARRSPHLCASRVLRITRIGSAPTAPTGFAASFAEDTVTYSWELPDDAPSLVVEARAGGWDLGRVIFTSGRGDRSFGPSSDWSAGRITVRSMNAAGHYSEPLVYDLDTSDVDRDVDATDVDPLLGAIEWADYEDGWIDDSSHASPKPVLVDLARDADGFLTFDGSALTGTYTTSDPTAALSFVRTRRELYIEANALAFSDGPLTGDAAGYDPNLATFSTLTGDGPAHNRTDIASGVTLTVEVRIARDGVGWSAWRAFHPALVQCVAVQYRLTATRATTGHQIQIRSFRTSVASKQPSLYDVTPEDLFLRSELDSNG